MLFPGAPPASPGCRPWLPTAATSWRRGPDCRARKTCRDKAAHFNLNFVLGFQTTQRRFDHINRRKCSSVPRNVGLIARSQPRVARAPRSSNGRFSARSAIRMRCWHSSSNPHAGTTEITGLEKRMMSAASARRHSAQVRRFAIHDFNLSGPSAKVVKRGAVVCVSWG